MNDEIHIEKVDILKLIYFIAEMTQNAGEKGMYGSLAGKSDLMGGIFDRWINLIPESAIFNKYILPKICNNKKVEVITDFYKYNPKQETTGIAPDVLGLRINNKIVPFTIFNEKWKPVDGMPQIEVKTFKKPQQMVSLRDQGYAGKYLVMVESNYRVDYLLPFFDNSYFSKDIYDKMIMDDKTFIVSNSKGLINHLKVVDYSKEDLGTLRLLTITETKKFENVATYCEDGVSPIRISSIEACSNIKIKHSFSIENCCAKQESGLYRFTKEWYDGEENGITYIESQNKSGVIKKIPVRILDFYCDKISSIQVLKKNKNNFYIKAIDDCTLNNKKLTKDSLYKLNLTMLNRASSNNGEYFLQKDLIGSVPNKEKELLSILNSIINKGE